MRRPRLIVTVSVVAFAAAAIGAGVTVAVSDDGSSSPAVSAGASSGTSYSYYRSMMTRFEGGSMMGGSATSMMGAAGYQSMMGGVDAPEWMRGRALPRYMMGSSGDPGAVMGRLFANQPGPRFTAVEAARLGDENPASSTVNTTQQSITFTGTTVHLVVLASPPGAPDDTFRIAGMVNPTITVPHGSRVSMEVINGDPDAAHGLVVTRGGAASSQMPMMSAAAAFSGSSLWFMGEPTSAGMHASTVRFTATTAGTYQYLCPVPGHARDGMVGSLVVAD